MKSIAPLDCALGISRLPFKMTVDLMLRCAYWAQNQSSYQDAEDALYEASHILVNDDTIRLVTNFIGREVFREDCARADAVFKQYDAGKLEFPASRKGVLYIEADGAALNTRHKDADGSMLTSRNFTPKIRCTHFYIAQLQSIAYPLPAAID